MMFLWRICRRLQYFALSHLPRKEWIGTRWPSKTKVLCLAFLPFLCMILAHAWNSWLMLWPLSIVEPIRGNAAGQFLLLQTAGWQILRSWLPNHFVTSSRLWKRLLLIPSSSRYAFCCTKRRRVCLSCTVESFHRSEDLHQKSLFEKMNTSSPLFSSTNRKSFRRTDSPQEWLGSSFHDWWAN